MCSVRSLSAAPGATVRAEVAALEANEADHAELRRVGALMEDLNAPW
jgi:hypothetical protein